MTTPLDVLFWTMEGNRMWESFSPLAMKALLAGANGGASALPVELQTLINWDLFNQSALAFLRRYRLTDIAGINDTTRRRVIEAINDWVMAGDPLSVLQDALLPIFGKTRADMIAVTEVTRVFAEGNLQLWNSTGVVSGKRWQTAVDERVCPICAPLHNRVVEIDGVFGYSDEDLQDPRLQSAIKSLGSTFQFPPAHPRCRCWLQPFVSEELLEQQIGGILAGQFFARVSRDDLAVAWNRK